MDATLHRFTAPIEPEKAPATSFLLDVRGTHIRVKAPYSGKVSEFMRKAYSARWDRSRNEWRINFWHADALPEDLVQFGHPVEKTERFLHLLARRSGLHSNERLQQLRQIKTDPTLGLDAKGFAPGLALFPFQRQDLAFILANNGIGIIADSPGLGKTATGLACATHLGGKTLVVCPAMAKGVWVQAIKKFLPHATQRVIKGGRPAKTDVTEDFTIVNYEVVESHYEYFLRQGYNLVLLDEGHYIKDPKRQRSKAVENLITIPHRVPLSGTPMPNGPKELFNLLHFLYPDIFDDYYSWGERFGGPVTIDVPIWVTKDGQKVKEHRPVRTYDGATHLHQMHAVLEGLMVRHLKEEVDHQLPPKIYSVIPVELDAETRRTYKAIQKDFLGWLRERGDVERAVKAERALALTQVSALKQLLLGAKRKAVEEMLEVLLDENKERARADPPRPPRKTIVFSNYVAPLEALKAKLGDAAMLVRGGMSEKQRENVEAMFETNPTVQVFLGQLQATCEALNLPAADTVIFHDLSWAPKDHQQGADRAHRLTTKHSVNVIFLVGKGTIEEATVEVLLNKMRTSSAVLDGKFDEVDLQDDMLLTVLQKFASEAADSEE